jgi:hypothetical protein
MTDTDQLATAFAGAQAEMKNAAFNRVNPHFKSKYADLSAIREATILALTKHGLSIVQYTTVTESGHVLLHTKLQHKSGQSIDSAYPIAMGTPQQMGSALTYARRYCWSAMCGVAADDDDDANAAEAAPKTNGRNSVTDAVLGTDALSKAKSRPIYEALINEMRAITVRESVTKWALENTPRIYSMHGDFQRTFRDEYKNHLTAIDEGVTEEGTPLVKQLKASLAQEEANGSS